MNPNSNPIYVCQICDQQIPAPGQGHSIGCRSLGSGAEHLWMVPPSYIESHDGKWYANFASRVEMTRRVPKEDAAAKVGK